MAGLTKQHFEEIARILNNSDYIEKEIETHGVSKERQTERNNTLYEISNALADYFKTQNPLFNKERFLKACLE